MSIRRAVAPRSVHVRFRPKPLNLSESREIFRVLQRFGEISSFYYLKYEYHNPAANVALVIFRDETSAQQALDASPIRFALEKVVNDAEPTQSVAHREDYDEHDPSSLPKRPTKDGIDEILRPSQLINRALSPAPSQTPLTPSKPPQTPMPFDPLEKNAAQNRNWTKWFQVTVDRSRAVQQDYVERQPYWKQFTPMRSMAQSDLEKRVPHIGLSDVSKRLPNHYRTPNRVLEEMRRYLDHGMPTLRGMAEDSEKERRFREKYG